jgi:hypothetical protein
MMSLHGIRYNIFLVMILCPTKCTTIGFSVTIASNNILGDFLNLDILEHYIRMNCKKKYKNKAFVSLK